MIPSGKDINSIAFAIQQMIIPKSSRNFYLYNCLNLFGTNN